MFDYSELSVNDSLQFLINKLWVFENRDSSAVETNRTIVPNGCFNIAFITGRGALVTFNREVLELKRGIYFCGQATRSVAVDILPETKVIMVQLFPWSASMLTDLDMVECRNKIVPVSYINNDFEREAGAVDQGDENIILQFLRDRFNNFLHKNEHTSLVHQSCISIMKNNGRGSIRDLGCLLGCSTRHLQILFLRYIGMSPKEFSIIIKMRNTIDSIAYPSSAFSSSLTSLALDNDFYDQSHFNNAFKAIINTAPKKFIPSRYILAFKNRN
jgi:AraC-like DNA-binding protein